MGEMLENVAKVREHAPLAECLLVWRGPDLPVTYRVSEGGASDRTLGVGGTRAEAWECAVWGVTR
jgi:hypothetical protein